MKADHKAPFLPTVAAVCLSQRSVPVSGKEDDASNWTLLSLWQAAAVLDGPPTALESISSLQSKPPHC